MDTEGVVKLSVLTCLPLFLSQLDFLAFMSEERSPMENSSAGVVAQSRFGRVLVLA